MIDDDLALADALQQPIDRLDREVRQRASAEPAVRVLTQLPGVGPFTALVILAEVGDISRFGSARKLAAWAGLTPTVRGLDRTVRHGHICKQGSAWLRWILCEAAQTAKRDPQFAASYQAIARRRGKGAFGALLVPQGFAILKATFDRKQLSTAFSAFGPLLGVAAVAGPILGGFIVAADIAGLSWRPMFLVNLVIGSITFFAALKVLPEVPAMSKTTAIMLSAMPAIAALR